MNYQIVPLGVKGNFKLTGVRFGENKFMYWNLVSTTVIRDVVIILDKKYENIEVKDGVMILSLKGINNYNDLKIAIEIMLNMFKANNTYVNWNFIVDNENQRQIIELLGKELGISYGVQNVNQNKEDELKTMEDKVNKSADVVGNHVIKKYNNGSLKEVTVHKDVDGSVSAYENNGMLNTEEEISILLRELMKDPVMANELGKMSPEELRKFLTDRVVSNRKQYRLESVHEQGALDVAGEVTRGLADNSDGSMVNSELRIVSHGNNKYSSVDASGDNFNIVNHEMADSNLNFDGSKNSVINSGGAVNQENVGEAIVYIDNKNNILDSNDNIIGVIGRDGYELDIGSNSVIRNGKFVGYVGDFKNKDGGKGNNKSNGKVRVLSNGHNMLNDDYESVSKSAAFISFPVILFILSSLLLISSLILLFVLD